ncbi:MAG: GGDEF domain-containing protein [Candidatus Omnitrophota bacterium]|nr:GGDEF domain-containing protein [Candidatus Omnitrophota bacterium]
MMLYLCICAVFLAALVHFIPDKIFFIPILSFLLFGIAVTWKEYRDSINILKSETGLKLENYSSEKNKLEKDITSEDSRIYALRNKEMMISSLYEITKNMSSDLTFNEIFGALSAFLKEYFVFKKSELLILKEVEGCIKVDKVYKLYKDENCKQEDAETNYDDMLTLFDNDKKEVYIPKAGGGSFGAIPLLSENKFVGILTIENLPGIDFDRFVIVAMQFALEIKKVLLYETVEGLAITDSLTGLYTRRYFFERLNEELNRSKNHGFKFTFLMIDIDDFKKCNDTHGHLVGDVVLKDIAHLIKENVREIDLVARYGGEEFSIILPETERIGAMLAAERIRKKIEEHIFKAYDEKLRITVSAGLAIYPDDAADMEDIVEKADKALYTAKSSGKNIVCEYKD